VYMYFRRPGNNTKAVLTGRCMYLVGRLGND
jgi:hypothetical protein